MRILVAPTAFKGTLSPLQAADAIGAAIREFDPSIGIESCPIADGGDGTAEVLVSSLGGSFTEHQVTGPTGETVTARIGWHRQTAIVEMASSSGLALVSEDGLDPMNATSYGTGELIREAVRLGAHEVIVAVGGSATSDAGAGIAQALGVRLTDNEGEDIPWGAAGLLSLEWIERLMPLVRIVVACDVENPLVGPDGSARVFGPQKGADAEQVSQIERALQHFRSIVLRDVGIDVGKMPRGGAAGGAAAGLHALLGAELRDGFEVVAEKIGFDDRLKGADLVIVGEGKLDSQSLGGKAAVAAARRSAAAGVEVRAIAGKVELSESDLRDAGISRAVDMSEEAGNRSGSDPIIAMREAILALLEP